MWLLLSTPYWLPFSTSPLLKWYTKRGKEILFYWWLKVVKWQVIWAVAHCLGEKFRVKYSAAAFMLHSFKLPNPYFLSNIFLFSEKENIVFSVFIVFSVLGISDFALVSSNPGKREFSLNTETCMLLVIIALIEKNETYFFLN